MNRLRRRKAKIRREIKKRQMWLRPEGGRNANNGNAASSPRSRRRDYDYLLSHNASAPDWY